MHGGFVKITFKMLLINPVCTGYFTVGAKVSLPPKVHLNLLAIATKNRYLNKMFYILYFGLRLEDTRIWVINTFNEVDNYTGQKRLKFYLGFTF